MSRRLGLSSCRTVLTIVQMATIVLDQHGDGLASAEVKDALGCVVVHVSGEQEASLAEQLRARVAELKRLGQ